MTEDFAQNASRHFFLRKPERFELDEIDPAELNDEEIRLAFSVFKGTLDEIVGAAQAFYIMSMAAVIDSQFNRLFVSNILRTKANFIRAGREITDEDIRQEARNRTIKEWEERENHDEILLQEASHRLIDLSSNTPELIAESNNAILRQSSVMLWSATETLLRDYLRISINRQPTLSKKLFESDETKRYWNARDLTIDVIQNANFNLQQSMGDAMIEINAMISLKSIKAAYSVVFPAEGLMKALKSQTTYNLFTLRNLVAHRNGLVDAKYLSETSFAVELGKKINISPAQFEELYMAAKSIGIELFKNATTIKVAV